MKFNKKNLPKTHEDLDLFVRQYGLRPFGRIAYKDTDIFIAETDVEMDRPIEYPWGYYQIAWFVGKSGKLSVGRWIEFDSMHDSEKNWTRETKRQARAETAIQDAIHFIDKSSPDA